MAAKLISEEGDLKGLVLSLDNGTEWIIGRDSDECQLVIPDPLISRKHAKAYLEPEGIYLQNLSETNPISINEEQMKDAPRLLYHGDNIRFGNEVFRYYTNPEALILDEEYPTKIEPETAYPVPDSSKELSNQLSDPTLLEDLNGEIPLLENLDETQKEADEDQPMADDNYHTILEENEDEIAPLAEINFGLADFGRWLVKVVSGPNNGAEFYMQSGYSYVIGTDPNTCDIVFHDTSVSRQHARITVTDDDLLTIEDMNSKNGILINNKQIDGKETLEPNQIVNIGTSSFIVYDREGDMQTIISPLLPSIVKALQGDDEKKNDLQESVEPFIPQPSEPIEEPPVVEAPPPPKSQLGKFLLIGSLVGLLGLIGMGTNELFKDEPVHEAVNADAEEIIKQAMTAYPSVKWSYNKSTNGLLLLGHVATASEKNQLLYTLHSLPTVVKTIDESGIIIDEGVWREINSILNKNAWQGITIHSPEAGKFVLTGTLKTRQQAEQLYNYIGVNFPYLDLLKRDLLVEEDVINQINGWLRADGFSEVTVKMANGEVSLAGNIPTNLANKLPEILKKVKAIPGVRNVYNFTTSKSADMGVKNITSQYQVTGSTKVGNSYTVQINGRILSEGDTIDGMTITSITPGMILLEDANKKFKIDYKG